MSRRIDVFALSSARRMRAMPMGVRSVGVRRWYSEHQPPTPQPAGKGDGEEGGSRVRAFYSSFGSPILKVFLGALFTYQTLYWGWLKLESLEVKDEKNEEIKILETKAKALVHARKAAEKSQ